MKTDTGSDISIKQNPLATSEMMTRMTAWLVAAVLTIAPGAAAGQADRSEYRAEYLRKQLDLTQEQTEQVQHVLRVDQDLAAIDRDRYGQDPDALRAATQKRIEETGAEIASVLNGEQKAKYEALKPSSNLDRRTLDLVARLNLDTEQTRKLEQIVAASGLEELQTKMRSSRGDRSAMMDMRDEIQNTMNKTDKQIETILTDVQKQEYDKVKKERQQEMESRREQMGGPQGGRGGRGGKGGGGGRQGW